MNDQICRRTFFKKCLGTAAVVSVAQLGMNRPAFAKDLPLVDGQDPTAKALGYVADAAMVDKEKFKRYEAGQSCATCSLYTGDAAAESGPCNIFPGKAVATNGWCSAWAKKA